MTNCRLKEEQCSSPYIPAGARAAGLLACQLVRLARVRRSLLQGQNAKGRDVGAIGRGPCDV